MARTAHDVLLPRPPGGMAPGAALAVLVHAGLLFALTAAVDWRLRKPDVTASAELWAAVPQAAAPRAAEPPPAPVPAPPPAPSPAPAPAPTPTPAAKPEPQRPDADIALERERRERDKKLQAEREQAQQAREQRERERREQAAQKLAQQQREAAQAKRLADAEAARKADAEALKKQREAEAREAKADEARLAQQREENLKRILGQAGAAGSGGPQATGSAAQDAGPTASYAGKLVALVRPNIVFTGSAEVNAAAEVEVRAGPSGSIISRRLVKASGQPDWDEAVLRAIDKTARLPRDTDGRVPPVIVMVFKPRD